MADTNDVICNICYDQLEIGANLVKADAIAIWQKEDENFSKTLREPVLGKYQIWLGKIGEAIQKARKGKLLKIARLSPSASEADWRKLAFKPIKGYVPTYTEEDEYIVSSMQEEVKSGNIKSFSALAETARKEFFAGESKTGVAALGVLKADVDNLGMIFGMGLNSEIQTLTRISVLSRQFNNFFAIYLPSLLEKNYRNVYTVFAGGDDLFLIGPWCEILELAPIIRQKFSEFVCHNSDIGLSMGVSLHKPGEPVNRMAQSAENALEKAKSLEGKDSICIFNETVNWENLDNLNKISEQIRAWVYKGNLNTAMLYRFNGAIEDIATQKKLAPLLETGKTVSFEKLANSMSWKPRLKYSLVRSIGRGEGQIKSGEAESQNAELTQIISWLEQHGTNMKIPIWQEIYRRRKN
jgi:CRISPR-associated protein Csm1